MRLIDADALIEEMKGSRYKANDGAYARGCNAVLDYFIREIPFRPTIDAVPVVRCKDCRSLIYVDNTPYCTEWERNTDEDGYCHKG